MSNGFDVPRRTVIASSAAIVTPALAGCSGLLGSGTPDTLPYGDRLVLERSDGIPFSNPWHYKEVVTEGDTLEGFDTPVWVIVLADNADFDGQPPEGQPARNFEIADGGVQPVSGEEPTNDLYFVLKGTESDGGTLKFIERTAAASPAVLLNGEVLLRTGSVEQGATFDLPPA